MQQFILKSGAALIAVLLITIFAAGQDPKLERTTYSTETADLGAGGTVTILGAPKGSISIEGWNKSLIEVTAETRVRANSESDLELLAEVTGFYLEADLNHVRVMTVGGHDRKYLKRIGKKLPKELRRMPFRVDYVIRVPHYSDIAVSGGSGDFTLRNVEGTFKIEFLESTARLEPRGGSLLAAFGAGSVDVSIPQPSWRGGRVDVQLVSGEMNVSFPSNMHAEIDASILRTGTLENGLKNLKPADRTGFTERRVVGKAGNGGAALKFTVGDGTLNLITR